uniref:Uncharacterized protein n=1 Tax=Pundamilia nyererei TaxID=303518 RepID=A0A3B4FHV4_9CICH
GISKTHLSLESISSSGLLTTPSMSVMSGGASIATMNLCLLFSLGS